MGKDELRPMAGFEGLYEIDTNGNIWSLNYRHIPGYRHRIKARIVPEGYWRVGLYRDKAPIACLVHRLVAATFIPNPENKPFINHKDGDRQNTHVSNLEWCTPKENIVHAATVLGTMRYGEDNPSSKLKEAQVLAILSEYSLSPRQMSQSKIAAKYGVSPTIIWAIVNKKVWRHLHTPRLRQELGLNN